MSRLRRLSATDLAAAIRSRHVSSHAAIAVHFRRVAAVKPAVNAVTVNRDEQAVVAAKAADQAVAGGNALLPFQANRR